MGHRPREDYCGAWHHVTGRGLARRPIFETERDVSVLLEGLESQVGEGRIEVHAYSVLTTHYHVLLRSLAGDLSGAMCRVLNHFARTFNIGRRRDGPVFRGRFSSRRVEDDVYWQAVLWYIDRNPIQAGLVSRSIDYPHGSAWWYARKEGPPWLRRDVVEALVMEQAGAKEYVPAAYPVRVGGNDLAWVDEVVERRWKGRAPEPADFRDLVRSSPEAVQSWMERKARLGDGTSPGVVLVTAGGLERTLCEETGGAGARVPGPGQPVLAALLRLFAGLTLEEVARLVGRSTYWVSQQARGHGERMQADATYRSLAARVLEVTLAREIAGLPPSNVVPIRLPSEDGPRAMGRLVG